MTKNDKYKAAIVLRLKEEIQVHLEDWKVQKIAEWKVQSTSKQWILRYNVEITAEYVFVSSARRVRITETGLVQKDILINRFGI